MNFSTSFLNFILSALIGYCVCSQPAQRFGDDPLPVVYMHPEQIHISYGGSVDKMYVTWVTFNYTLSSVQYGINGLQQTVNGTATKFVDGGSEHRVLFVHRVLLPDLKPDTKYWYHCGSPVEGWSELYFFKTFKSGVNWSPNLIIYGDMGNKDPVALPYIQQEAQMGNIDAVLHIGITLSGVDCNDNELVYRLTRYPTQLFRKINKVSFFQENFELYSSIKQCKYGYHWNRLHQPVPMIPIFAWFIEKTPRYLVCGRVTDPGCLWHPLQSSPQFYCVLCALWHTEHSRTKDNARLGDEFMRQIQSIAAYVPYMVSPGNHEEKYNFSNYKNRFTMPGGDGQGMFYSWDVGPVHFLSFSSEVYFYYVSQETIKQQLEFIENDLIEANKPENRGVRPWIIALAHRPMYCADRADIDITCLNPLNPVRINGIEDLLYKYGVDMYFAGHEHNYERMWPVYNLKICNGSYDSPYTNPKATVHMVTGSAGMYSGKDPFIKEKLPWDAFRSMDFGYTKMVVQNSTHLFIEQISADKKGAVIDTMTLIKTKHDPSVFDCHW